MDVSSGAQAPTRVYVGGLADEVTEDTLRGAFAPFGELVDVVLPLAGPAGKDGAKHKGFAFVQYDLAEDAADAVDNMHRSEIFGRVIKCQLTTRSAHGSGGASGAVWNDDSYWAADEVAAEAQDGLNTAADATEPNAKRHKTVEAPATDS